MDASTTIAPRTARPAAATSPTTTPVKANAPKPAKAATSAAVLTRPASEPASRRDATDGVHAIGRPAGKRLPVTTLPAFHGNERNQLLPRSLPAYRGDERTQLVPRTLPAYRSDPTPPNGPTLPGARGDETGRPSYIPFVPAGSPLDILLKQRGPDVIGGRPGGANGATRANAVPEGDPGAPPADRAPDELRKVLRGIGGAARGVATAGSGIAQTIARGAPFKFGRVPGAAVLTGGLALYDTVREFQRSGLSDATARTAAGGIGGVAGAFKGGAIGASIGALGGPVGAVVGGAAGAIIGGIAGSSVGQGVADGFAAARDVIRNAEVHDVGDVFEVAGEAAWEGAKAFGSTAWNGISSQVSDIAGGIADGAGWVADRVGDVAEEVADTVSDAVDTVTDVAGDVADTAGDIAEGALDVAGDVLDSITPW